MPWMFALDHTHSRWLSVHIPGMMSLSDKHPYILSQFKRGNFVLHKTSNKLSAIAIDQCNEQNNGMVKGSSGGAISITSNPSALRRRMVAGPEVARTIMEFEDHSRVKTRTDDTGTESPHQDVRPLVKVEFMKDVRAMVAVINELGNPFMEDSEDLMVLDTKYIMDDAVTDTMRRVETLGREQYEKFVCERLERCSIPITYNIQNQTATVKPTTDQDAVNAEISSS